MTELEEFRAAVHELPGEALDELTAFAALARGAGLKPTVSPTGEEILLPDPDWVLPNPRPTSESAFWNAIAVLLVAERRRRSDPVTPTA